MILGFPIADFPLNYIVHKTNRVSRILAVQSECAVQLRFIYSVKIPCNFNIPQIHEFIL